MLETTYHETANTTFESERLRTAMWGVVQLIARFLHYKTEERRNLGKIRGQHLAWLG